MAHERKAGAGAGPKGLSECQTQNMIGNHERAVAFGSQVVA